MKDNQNYKSHIENKLNTCSKFKDNIIKIRTEHCERTGKGDYEKQLAQSYGDLDLLGYISRRAGKKEFSADISGHYFNKGFKEKTGVDLYQHNIGNREKDLNGEQNLYQSLFKRNLIITSLVLGAILIGHGISIGLIWGLEGALIGGAIGIGATALLAPPISHITAKGEKVQSKYDVEQRSRDRGESFAENLITNIKLDQEKEKNDKRYAEVNNKIAQSGSFVEKISSKKEGTCVGPGRC